MEQLTENKMGVMPVKRLLIHMSWPMMLSMLVQALYNLVDSFFVAQLDPKAFLALSLAFPMQTLMIAVQVGTGVGINALLSRRLGEGRVDEASAAATNGIFLYLLTWLFNLLYGLLLSGPFMRLFSEDPVVISYGRTYLTIVMVFSIGACMQFAGERVLQATGDPIGPMIIQGVGAVANLILDPLLIFGLFGFPRLGVAGAAIATVLGQLLGMLCGFFMVRRNKLLTVRVRGFRPNWRVVRDIYCIGLPAIAMQALLTVMTFGMNKILTLFSDTGVYILGAYFKLQSFIFMPVFGLNNGLIPVVSFNFGAKNRARVTELIRFALVIAAAIMGTGTVLLLCFPSALLLLFNAPGDVLADGIPALRMVSLSFVFAGVSIILCAAFQALGASLLSLMVSLMRQTVILLPTALLLGFLNPGSIWLAFLAAEAFSCLLSLLLYRRLYKNKISKIGG